MDKYINKQELLKNFCGYDLTKCQKHGNETPEQLTRSYATLMMYEIAMEIDDAPAADVQPIKRGEWHATKRHLWYKDKDGNPDISAYSEGYCNGVLCKKCGRHVCIYCHPDWESEDGDDECYYEHYECSCCGWATMEKTPYCPHCGAEMDGEDGEQNG